MQTSSLVGLDFRCGQPPRTRTPLLRPKAGWAARLNILRRVLGLAALVGGGITLPLFGCGLTAQEGDCGPYLSSAECQVVRTQLGALDRRPPPDPTNRFGRCVADNSAECTAEDNAVKLGQLLFFDRCLSVGNNVACVTCHQPSQAFTDSRVRDITTSTGLPLIEDPTTDRVKLPPPMVQAMVDSTGAPLAHWVVDPAGAGAWTPVRRRPMASLGSATAMGKDTARHSPSLYNIAYGGGIAALHGERTYGVTWTPWDGRYDSAWALVADVLEFGGTQSSDRAHIAIRIGQKYPLAYDNMIGPLFNFNDTVRAADGTMKYLYLRHGSPAAPATSALSCWYSPTLCPTTVMPATDAVRANINEVFVNAGKALGAYLRRLRSASSPYDRWLAGDSAAMSAAAQRGLGLFIGKAECVLCHNGPNFTDWRFHNLGIPTDDPEHKVAGSVMPTKPEDRSLCFDGLGPDRVCPDPGRQGWQLRAAGLCPSDPVMIGTGPVDKIVNRTVSCQPVDQPRKPPSNPMDKADPSKFDVNKFDIEMDCRSPQSDATDKDAQCLPATVADATRCFFTTGDTCNKDPLCQWVEATGRCLARVNAAELGQFKTPSLRNVGLTFPYMHNGLLYNYGPAENKQTSSDDPTPHLTRVVEFYNGGGGKPDVGTLDSLIHPLHLAAPEVTDLVEFLKALTDNSMATASDPLTIDPFEKDDFSDCPQ